MASILPILAADKSGEEIDRLGQLRAASLVSLTDTTSPEICDKGKYCSSFAEDEPLLEDSSGEDEDDESIDCRASSSSSSSSSSVAERMPMGKGKEKTTCEGDIIAQLTYLSSLLKKKNLSPENQKAFLYLRGIAGDLAGEEIIELIIKVKMICDLQNKQKFNIVDVQHAVEFDPRNIESVEVEESPWRPYLYPAIAFVLVGIASAQIGKAVGSEYIYCFFNSFKNISFRKP